MQCTAPNPRHARLSTGYHVLPYTDTDKVGLRVGHTAAARVKADEWVRSYAADVEWERWRNVEGPSRRIAAEEIARRASVVAWELMENAHRYSHSGAPGQTLTLTLERTPYLLTISVTDAGPTPGRTKLSFPEQKDHGGGLKRVANLSVYWDWDGCAGLPVTVRALLDLPDR